MNLSIFSEFPELKFEAFDLLPIQEHHLNDLEYLCQFRPPDRRGPAKELLEQIQEEYGKKNAINWGIFDEHKLIGTIGFYRGFENNEGEIGYMLIPSYQQKGIMSKMVPFFLKFAKERMQLSSVCAYTAPDNIGSQKVLTNSGLDQIQSDENDFKYRIRFD